MNNEKQILTVKKLSKSYDGNNVVNELSFSISSGQMLGLVGPNGAGKSTTLKCITGQVKPEHGDINICGFNLWQNPVEAKKNMAYIPEMPLFYDELTVYEHLKFVAMAFQVPEAEFKEKAEYLLDIFSLSNQKDQIPTLFSKGMKQKVAVMMALIHEAEVLLVDEPFVGLDPMGINKLKELLLIAIQEGRGVLLCTHLLDIAEKLCTDLVIINKGNKLYEGKIDKLKKIYAQEKLNSLEEIFLKLTGVFDEQGA